MHPTPDPEQDLPPRMRLYEVTGTYATVESAQPFTAFIAAATEERAVALWHSSLSPLVTANDDVEALEITGDVPLIVDEGDFAGNGVTL